MSCGFLSVKWQLSSVCLHTARLLRGVTFEGDFFALILLMVRYVLIFPPYRSQELRSGTCSSGVLALPPNTSDLYRVVPGECNCLVLNFVEVFHFTGMVTCVCTCQTKNYRLVCGMQWAFFGGYINDDHYTGAVGWCQRPRAGSTRDFASCKQS